MKGEVIQYDTRLCTYCIECIMSFDIERFKQVTVALNTPFDMNGDVDVEATKRLCNYFYDKGVRSLYVCGSTGEGLLLDQEERKKVVEAVCEAVGDKMTIIVHVGTPSTKLSCELAAHAEKAGAHATSAVPNIYYHLSEESIYTHWTEITRASNLPFFIYNIPQLTGYALSMELLDKMLANEKVIGIKNSSDAPHDILRFKKRGGENFIVFNGPDEQYLAGHILGADAGIGGTYGAMPELYIKLEELIRAHKYDEAIKVQNIITPLIYRLCSFKSMYGACKAIITLDGCPIGAPRLPFLPVSIYDPNILALYEDIKKAIEEVKDL